MMKTPLPHVLLFACNGVFLLLYMTLCWNNRLATDDFHFLANLHEHGIIGGTMFEYNTWSSRYASVLLNHVVLALHERFSITLFFFGIINLTLLAVALRMLLDRVIERMDITLKMSPFLKWNLAILTAFALFESTFRIGETWFWLCASCTYLWSLIMLLFVINWLLHPRPRLIHSMSGIFGCLYIGGALGPLALIGMGGLVFFLVAPRSVLLLKLPTKRSIIALASLVLAFLFLWMAEGNTNRQAFFQEIGFFEGLLLNVKMTAAILVLRVPMILPFVILFSAPLYLVGHQMQDGKAHLSMKRLLYLVALFIGLIFLYQWPITFKTQHLAAFRTLMPVALLTLSFFGFLAYLIGKSSVRKAKPALISALLALVLIVVAVQCWNQVQVTHRYATAYDERMSELASAKDCQGTILVKVLPPSGMLHSAEISTDQSFYSNVHLMKGLRLDCPINLKESVPDSSTD